MKQIVLFTVALLLLAGCEPPQRSNPSNNTTDSSSGINGTSINIKANSSGKFVCCDGDQNQMIIGNRDRAARWEEFRLIKIAGDTVAFKASNGKYVCADMNNGGILSANRDKVGDWESFVMIPQKNNKVAFKASNNKYVSCDLDLKGILVANRNVAKDWELFIIIYK